MREIPNCLANTPKLLSCHQLMQPTHTSIQQSIDLIFKGLNALQRSTLFICQLSKSITTLSELAQCEDTEIIIRSAGKEARNGTPSAPDDASGDSIVSFPGRNRSRHAVSTAPARF